MAKTKSYAPRIVADAQQQPSATATSEVTVGGTVVLPAGTKVKSQGTVETRTTPTKVTVRAIEYTKAGKVNITWKSRGYAATTTLK